MKEIAQKAGVSRATVSRVINGHSSVSAEKRKIVMEWVRKLDYQPNKIAQSLVQSQSHLIGVIVPNISNPFFSEIIDTVEYEANRQGYSIVVCNTRGNIQKEKNHINTLKSRQVDGILIVPIIDINTPHIDSFQQGDIPVVAITRKVHKFDSVLVSHKEGGAQVARHFIDMGHRDIGFIGLTKDEKFKGLKGELNKNGIEFDSYNLIEGGYEGRISSEKVYTQVKDYLDKGKLKATAFFAYNDLAALGAIHAFQDYGLKIPDDIIVAGFDDIFLASQVRPNLTSVAQPTQEMGRVAIEILLNRISEENTKDKLEIELEPSLIVRESTRGINFK